MPSSLNSESMPKVRASSGMIGTMRGPISESRHSERSSRVNAVVVDAACVPDPAVISSYTVGLGRRSGRRVATWRDGRGPSSARRRPSRYSVTGESSGGRTYGGTSPSNAESGSTSVRCSRSRSSISWAAVIFLIWWVELRPSKPEPSVQPLTVFARMTVGTPSVSTAA